MTETKKPRKNWCPRNDLGLTPAESRLHLGMLRIADPDGLVHLSAVRLCKAVSISPGRWHLQMGALRERNLVQLARAGGGGHAAVYRVFATPQAEWPPLPALPPISRGEPKPLKVKPDTPPRPVAVAEPSKRCVIKLKYCPRTGALLNGWAKGTADEFDIGTAEERIAKVPDAERARIAAQYGARFG